MEKHLYECLITSNKSTSKIGEKILVFFTFFINFFMKRLIKRIIYCRTVLLERLLVYVVKTICQASLLSLVT